MQSVIDIHKQDRDVMKKASTNITFRNKMRPVCEEDDCYLDKERPFKRARRQAEKYETLLLQVTVLYSKENSFVWCKGYG